MSWLNVVRGSIYALVILFSLGVMGFTIFEFIVPLFIVIGFEEINVLEPFDSLALAAAVITIVFLPVTLLLECCMRKPFTSLVAVELARIGILWPIWVAAGARFYQYFPFSGDASLCGVIFSGRLEGVFVDCVETVVVPALAMANFSLLFIWFLILFIFAAKNNHWTSLVHRVDLTKRKDSQSAGPRDEFVYPQQMPPTQQMVYWVSANATAPVQPQPQGPGYWVAGPPPPGAVPQGLPQRYPPTQQEDYAWQPSQSQSPPLTHSR